MARQGRTGNGARGFTLLEVIIALVIASFTLVAAFEAFSTGLMGTVNAGRHTTAVVLAEARLAALGPVEPVRAGTSTGRFADGYDWSMTVQPVLPPDDGGGTQSPTLYEVVLDVRWVEAGRRRNLVLRTFRVATEPNS